MQELFFQKPTSLINLSQIFMICQGQRTGEPRSCAAAVKSDERGAASGAREEVKSEE